MPRMTGTPISSSAHSGSCVAPQPRTAAPAVAQTRAQRRLFTGAPRTCASSRALTSEAKPSASINASATAALKLHDLLYENQPYEQNADDTTDADIMKWVKEAGGDNAAVESAAKTKDEGFFSASEQGAQDVGLTGTPTVLINGKKLDNMSVDQIVSEIEDRVTAGK